jgi:uncharacterized membrane protein SpoIIM required for sporulation
MFAETFIATKRASWERLTALIRRAQNSLSELSADELNELGRLYRQATSDLAVARRDFPRHQVHSYLNGLVGQAHGVVYRGRNTRFQSLIEFFTSTFPRIFRETWGYTFASFLMFFIPALIGYIVTYRSPESISLLVPGAESVLSEIREGREWWLDINEEGRAFSSSRIMTNNIQVTFLAFAGGILFGLLSLYILAFNGLFLGSIAGAAHALDFGDNLWGFVAAHGTIELSIIFLAGGAGLQLGWALIRPGLLTRRSALVLATRRAAYLLLGSIPWMITAGVIEGFISPSSLPLAIKLTVSLVSGIVLYSYLLLAGRQQPKHNNNL